MACGELVSDSLRGTKIEKIENSYRKPRDRNVPDRLMRGNARGRTVRLSAFPDRPFGFKRAGVYALLQPCGRKRIEHYGIHRRDGGSHANRTHGRWFERAHRVSARLSNPAEIFTVEHFR